MCQAKPAIMSLYSNYPAAYDYPVCLSYCRRRGIILLLFLEGFLCLLLRRQGKSILVLFSAFSRRVQAAARLCTLSGVEVTPGLQGIFSTVMLRGPGSRCSPVPTPPPKRASSTACACGGLTAEGSSTPAVGAAGYMNTTHSKGEPGPEAPHRRSAACLDERISGCTW